MRTIALLTISNIFMTFAWYGHLKYRNVPLFKGILLSWMIAFFEYCFQVPANRIGSYECTAAQLKTIQEVITLVFFSVFSVFFRKQPIRWKSVQQIDRSLVPEMTHSGENHGQPQAVSGCNDFGIPLRAPGLNDGSGAGLGDFFHSVGEREKSVRGRHRSFQRELGLHGADPGGVDSTHLARSHPDRLPVAGIYDGIGFDVFAYLPGE